MTTGLLDEAYDLARHYCQATGPNVMYFETGQGSALSADAHYGCDQVTMEARCYGLARRYQPFMVNTVVGFIGPEYLYNHQQIIRAALEDHFMGKLHGLPMGCDCCYTNHADTRSTTSPRPASCSTCGPRRSSSNGWSGTASWKTACSRRGPGTPHSSFKARCRHS